MSMERISIRCCGRFAPAGAGRHRRVANGTENLISLDQAAETGVLTIEKAGIT